MFWVVPLIIMFTFLASRGARIAAVEWGDMVKASFDTFVPKLSKKLGFITPEDTRPDEEKKLWTLFSRAMIYRSQEDMDDLLQELSMNRTTQEGARGEPEKDEGSADRKDR